MSLQAGETLYGGDYRVVRSLNEGRVGVSYLAQHKGGDRVVLKTLRDQVLADLTSQEREKFNNKLTNEAVKLARCHHPHIVRCFGSFLEQGQAFIVMEFVAGDDLASLSTTTLPEEEALIYIRQVGEALTVVHGEGLVHRDIKPANIMLRAGQSEAVLIDFGVTKGFNETLTSIRSSNSDGYSALELYDPSEKAQPYSDVYGLAATLYTLLSGDVPPHAEERAKLESKGRKLPPISGVSSQTNRAIREGMKVDYGDRLQTIEEFLALLPVPQKVEPSPPPTPPDRLNLYMFYAAIVAIIVTIIVGIFAQDIRRAIDDWFLSPGVEQRDEY
ncbi:serine/threonine protein kinase [Phormidium yuhuli AB48]|uniref:Serine/threonine protein kinase n=1 Tax=Phormidium yuhuli AB48 TaxID=2940671 RepID=A0ABY5APA8_9CYAN|nr:serine/threonine-protein kinase [Phormidium yuhuli]USR91049.1 serine/threonine protein kinase [Phormidium yuhuli AB48]